MPSFTFTARDPAGQPRTGELEAETPNSAVAELRARGWIVLDVKAEQRSQRVSLANLNPLRWLPPAKIDVEIAFGQLASMLRAGMTLISALKTAAEQARRPSMAAILTGVSERIQEGSSFASALEKHPRTFPNFVVQLVRVGEQSGTLEVVLTRAAEQLERARNLKLTVFNALMYPAIVLVMAIAVTVFMLVSLIPKLQKFLAFRGHKLPAITQTLIDVSTFLQVWLPYILVGIISGIIAMFFVYRWPPGRAAIDRFVLRVPIVGRILRTSATAMFSRTMSLLLESGVTLLSALQTVEALISNRALSEHIAAVRQSVMQGGTLAGPLGEASLFMPMLSRMVAVGESTGSLDPVLAEVALFHEKDLAATVRRLSILIEPAIIIVVGGIVGFVYIAFFSALYSVAT